MKRLLSTAATLALTTSLMAAPLSALDLTALSDEDRTALRAEIRAYLLDNPEVIFEAVEILEQRQAAQEEADDQALVAAYSDEIFNDGFSWVGGNPDGDITLVEFVDYRCGYCRRAMPEIENLLAQDGNIRLVIKEFPILGEASLTSSRFAIATRQLAGGDAYKQVHDALMEFSGEPTDIALTRLADSFDLDASAILAHMTSDKVTNEIAQTRNLARNLKISGTPTFVLGTEMLRGYLPGPAMAQIAEQQRAAN